MTTVIVDTLKALPLFQHCPKETCEQLATHSHLDSYKKGQILFLNGEQAHNFFFLQKGWVKLFRETLDGDQAIIDILPPHTLFGEAILYESKTYNYSAEVVEEAQIIRMPLKILHQEIEKNGLMALSLLKSMTRRQHAQEMEIEHLTLQNAPQRIGCFLLRLIDQKQTEGPIIIHLPYDKTLLAARLGMQPETFSRALTRLREETGIEIKGSTVMAQSLSQLSHYSCAACSSGFPCSCA